jgi:hypothetical protein
MPTNEHRIKAYRNKQVGDVFYIPVDRNVEALRDGKGAYIPNSDHQVVIIQIINMLPRFGTQFAVYQGLYRQGDIYSLDVEKLLEAKVLAIYVASTPPISKGQWPFLGNYPEPYDMPHQAYERSNTLANFMGTMRKLRTQKHKNIQFISDGIAGGLEEIARGVNGLDTAYKLDYESFTPNPKATLRKIFPEYYR